MKKKKYYENEKIYIFLFVLHLYPEYSVYNLNMLGENRWSKALKYERELKWKTIKILVWSFICVNFLVRIVNLSSCHGVNLKIWIKERKLSFRSSFHKNKKHNKIITELSSINFVISIMEIVNMKLKKLRSWWKFVSEIKDEKVESKWELEKFPQKAHIEGFLLFCWCSSERILT